MIEKVCCDILLLQTRSCFCKDSILALEENVDGQQEKEGEGAGNAH